MRWNLLWSTKLWAPTSQISRSDSLPGPQDRFDQCIFISVWCLVRSLSLSQIIFCYNRKVHFKWPESVLLLKYIYHVCSYDALTEIRNMCWYMRLNVALFLLLNPFFFVEAFSAPVFQGGPDKNGFNVGMRRNLQQVFGEDRRLWFVPVFTRSEQVSISHWAGFSSIFF